MLRSTRVTAALIRSLTFGATAVVATATVSSVVSCKDESQPEYWVEKLSDAKWKPRSIKRLEQFYSDAMTKAGEDRTKPEVKKLLDLMVPPLTKVYIDDFETMDSKTRTTLIKLLASTQDERAIPAFKKVFDEYAAKPKKKDFDDLKAASIVAGTLREAGKGDELGKPMLNAFLKMKRSTPVGAKAFKDLPLALLKKVEKSWAGPLISAMEPEIPAKSKDTMVDYMNQVSTQVTAARLLGEIGDPSAVEPLLMAMLDPHKRDLGATALVALVKLGKPAADRAVKLLEDKDEKLRTHSLAKYQKFTKAKKPPTNKPYRETAAIILGTMGRTDTIPAMLAVIADKEVKAGQKALIMQELSKIPATDDSKKAFKEFYEGLSLETRIPGSTYAHAILTERAGYFFDATLVDWLLERAEKTKAKGEDAKTYKANITVTAMKLMKADQVDKVSAAVEKYGTKIEKDKFKQAATLVKACGDRADCYLEKMQALENQEKKQQFVAIKAGYMLAILGDEKTRDALIAGLSKIENAAIRFVASAVIDYLSPKGSKEAAAALKKIIDLNAKSMDRRKAMGDNALKQVMYRIKARAE